MKWVEAFSYGLKFFIISVAFTVMGAFLILSSLSINFYIERGRYVITFDAVNLLTNVGSLTLLAIGFAILVIGNVTAFIKILSEAIKNMKEYVW